MIILFVIAAVVLFAPIVITILRSLNILHTQVGSYYDFGVIFQGIKPWTMALYISIVLVLTFIVLLLAGLPVAKLPA